VRTSDRKKVARKRRRAVSRAEHPREPCGRPRHHAATRNLARGRFSPMLGSISLALAVSVRIWSGQCGAREPLCMLRGERFSFFYS
jgi:hypothetical protein